MGFNDTFLAAARRNESLLCIGLDPDPQRIPECLGSGIGAVESFLFSIIDATSDVVCCYKPNSAFFEQFGKEGWALLERLRTHIPTHIPMLLDAKRGDIGNTAAAYARAAFEVIGADAITLNPMMGCDTVEPFMKYKGKGLFLLCLTSNPGASDFELKDDLYLRIAKSADGLYNNNPEIGLVVGATQPEYIGQIRAIFKDGPLLIPGIGTQGGDLETVLKSAGNNVLINVSRAVLYASADKDFAEAARDSAIHYRELIKNVRTRV